MLRNHLVRLCRAPLNERGFLMVVKLGQWKKAAAFAALLDMTPVGFAQAAPQTVIPNKPVAAVSSPAVRDVAAHPAAHLGRLSLSGVVGIATAGKGFVLIDMREYRQEGLACLTNREKTKIPVVWSGAAPKVRQAVRVDGTLAKTATGYVFTAAKVAP